MYEERQQILVDKARKNCEGSLEVAPAAAGMHLIGWLPQGIDDREVSHRAAEANMKIAPVSVYCLNQKLRGGLLLGYTAFNERQIKLGMKKLARVLDEIVQTGIA